MLGTDFAFWFSTQDNKTKLIVLASMVAVVAICALLTWLQDKHEKNL